MVALHSDRQAPQGGETKNLKDKMFDIETLANDIDNKIKEAIDREVLFS